MLAPVIALLVDLYDTLVWTDWSLLSQRLTRRLGVAPATLMDAFESTSLHRGTGRYGSVAGDLGAVLAACGVPGSESLLGDLAAETVDFMQRNVHLYDDVLPVLRKLRASGTRIALVSNCDHATRPILETLDLEREVDALVLSCEVGSAKPDAPIFLEAMRRLGVDAPDSLFVDDQERFLDGAVALGIRAARIARRGDDPGDRRPAGHRVINSLTELL